MAFHNQVCIGAGSLSKSVCSPVWLGGIVLGKNVPSALLFSNAAFRTCWPLLLYLLGCFGWPWYPKTVWRLLCLQLETCHNNCCWGTIFLCLFGSRHVSMALDWINICTLYVAMGKQQPHSSHPVPIPLLWLGIASTYVDKSAEHPASNGSLSILSDHFKGLPPCFVTREGVLSFLHQFSAGVWWKKLLSLSLVGHQEDCDSLPCSQKSLTIVQLYGSLSLSLSLSWSTSLPHGLFGHQRRLLLLRFVSMLPAVLQPVILLSC